MFTTKPIESYFFAIYEPYPPQLFDGLLGKVSLCHASRSAPCGFVPLSVHSVRLDDESRLRVNLVDGDPPSIRSARVLSLYQLAVGALGKRNDDHSQGAAMYWGKDGKLKTVGLDDFKAGRLAAMHEKSDDLELPYFDELARQVGYLGEPMPIVPYGCELHESEDGALKWYSHPLDGEPMFLEGFAPDMVAPALAAPVDARAPARGFEPWI